MMSHRSFIKTLACLVALGASTIGGMNVATAEVVFGNLGANGTGSLNGTNTDIVVSATTAGQYSGLAQGFTTGSNPEFLTLQSVTLGLFAEVGVPNRSISIYSNSGNVPGSELHVSNSIPVSSLGAYTFSFSNIVLSPSTRYWIVPQPDVSWHNAQPQVAPTAQNSSGYAYNGSAEKTFETSNSWTDETPAVAFSVSINAVPEPSTYAMAAIGAGVAGLMGWRRRKVAADAAAAV